MIDFNNIDHILLDMDGTLLDLNFDCQFWLEYVPTCFAKNNHITIEMAKEHIFPIMKRHEGTIEWYCLDFWTKELQLDIVKLKHDLRHLIQPLPHTISFLTALKKAKKRIILVTNAHRGSLNLKLKVVNITPFFDAIISSHDFGIPKENSSFWLKLKKIHSFENEKTLLIDDSESVLISAKKYGIKNLITISQPDSQQPARISHRFDSIKNLGKLLPIHN